MPISIAEHHELICACGEVDTRLVWVAVDVEERPDLADLLRTPDGYLAPCPACRELVVRAAPVLVVRMAETAPVVLGCPEERLELDDPTVGSEELLEQVNEAMRRQRRTVPGPVLCVPFAVLLTALGRDVDRDVADPGRAVRAVATVDEEAAHQYGLFLEIISESAVQRRVGAALDDVAGVSSETELQRMVASYPELLTEEARGRVGAALEVDDDPRSRRLHAAQLAMLDACAAGDIAGGWAAYERELGSFARDVLEAETAPLIEAFDAVVEDDGAAAVVIGEQMVAKATDLGALDMEAAAATRTANAYYELAGDRRANLERSRELLERALDIYEHHADVGDQTDRAQASLSLGAVLGSRFGGDPATNQERAIALQRRVLELVSMQTDGRSWAMAHTNLGMNLLERPNASSDGSLEAAIGHFEQALQWRSFERDPLDWAYTQVNLALAYARRTDRDRAADLRRAVHHNTEAVGGFAAANHVANGAQALSNRATSRTSLALLKETSRDERAALLAVARDDAREAITMLGEHSTGVDAGRRWAQLGRVLAAGESYTHEVVEVHQRALSELTPQAVPRECRNTARRLAELAADAGDWEIAAHAWEQAALAGAAAVEARATRKGRFVEMHDNLNLFRWAAYALLRAGRPRRAVEILELGRGRELASWLAHDVVDLAPVRRADARLAGRFVDLRQRIEAVDRAGSAVADPVVARAVEELRATVDEIRRLPGLEGFLGRPSFADLIAGAPAGEVIAYPLTAPNGTARLLLRGDAEDPITVIDLPALTSTSVFEALAQPGPKEGLVVGYLAEQAVTGPRLDAEIAAISRVLGPELLRPLADALTRFGASEVCIVPIGLLGLVPLHGLTWQQGGSERCLLDQLAVSYAPSAYVRRVCQARAAVRVEFGRLVAVGNPLPHSIPLDGAEYEAELVGQIVPAPAIDLLLRFAATKEATAAALPGASHVHLACHGCAAVDAAALDAALFFDRDRPMSALEILDLDLGQARLIVASACETGVIPGYETADESLSLSTVFLGAGAAGVISSLWEVNDYATSLLMTRFYEELVRDPASPAQALRTAQLWLRHLTAEDEERWVARHSTLAVQRAGHATASVDDSRGRGQTGRWAAPAAWAAFMFSGA